MLVTQWIDPCTPIGAASEAPSPKFVSAGLIHSRRHSHRPLAHGRRLIERPVPVPASLPAAGWPASDTSIPNNSDRNSAHEALVSYTSVCARGGAGRTCERDGVGPAEGQRDERDASRVGGGRRWRLQGAGPAWWRRAPWRGCEFGDGRRGGAATGSGSCAAPARQRWGA